MEWVISAKPRGSTRTYVQPDRRPPTAWRSGILGSAQWPAFNGIDNDWKRLPIRPIWPGFLINTLFYTIVLWLLIPGPFALRRLIRIKRGRCRKCGYDLRGTPGSGCPECGWNREPEPAG